MDEQTPLGEVEKNAAPSPQAVLYQPAPSVEERRAAGLAAREACPIASLGTWKQRASSDTAVDLLEQQSVTRDPSLVPLRYERMGVSPFTFYRGSAVIMAADLATMPVTDLEVQCIGDAHVGNFGIFMSHTRHLVFDVNDFDETAPGPWEWDVMRLVASIEICGRDRGFSKADRRNAVRACAKQYRHAMARFAEMGELDVWHAHLDVERMLDEFELDGKTGRTIRKVVEKAREKDSVRAADRLTVRDDGRLRFDTRPPELVPLSELTSAQGYDASQLSHTLCGLLDAYFESLPRDCRALLGRYRLQDAARKVVGVGSVGRRAWIALLTGRDENDPLVIQVKEAESRSWSATGGRAASRAMASAWWRASASCSPRATFCWAGRACPRQTGAHATTTCASSGTARARSTSPRSARRASRTLRDSARGRSRTRTPAPATRSPLRPTLTTGAPSRTRCGTSPTPTPTRTRQTTRHSLNV